MRRVLTLLRVYWLLWTRGPIRDCGQCALPFRRSVTWYREEICPECQALNVEESKQKSARVWQLIDEASERKALRREEMMRTRNETRALADFGAVWDRPSPPSFYKGKRITCCGEFCDGECTCLEEEPRKPIGAPNREVRG